MKLNRLLQKQLKKFLPDDTDWSKEQVLAFVQAVHESYDTLEREVSFLEHTFKITEEEYQEVNERLQYEVALKEESVHKLKEIVEELGGDVHDAQSAEEELTSIAIFIKEQIALKTDIEIQLLEQQKFFEQILNHIPINVYVFDRDMRYSFINPNALNDAEDREWIIGKTIKEYYHYKQLDEQKLLKRENQFKKVLDARKGTSWEESFLNANGELQWYMRFLYPFYDANNNLQMLIGYGVDISESKSKEQSIILNKAKYRSVYDNSLALIIIHDLEGNLIDINPATKKALGFTEDHIKGQTMSAFLTQASKDRLYTVYWPNLLDVGRADGVMSIATITGKEIQLLYQSFVVDNGIEQPYVIVFAQDITDRVAAEIALKKSEEKYRSIIENMSLGLIEVDAHENIIEANQTFCDLSGYTYDELVGNNAISLFNIAEDEIEVNQVTIRRQSGIYDAYEKQVVVKDGSIRWWLISGAPIFDNDGNFKGSVGIHFDITKQKELEAELRKAKDDAERSNMAKELFMANMSHEIRTPMNAVLGIGSLLSKTEMNQQQSFYLKTIQTAANNLLVIINDLLDFSKIEAGKIAFEEIGFDVYETVQNSIQVLKHKAEEKGLAIHFDFSEAIAPVLIGDPYRINQVLMNLLSNAIKFTEKGFVALSCMLEQDTPNEQFLVFKVVDSGIGISEDFLYQLFDKFAQEDRSITRKYGGTGLGMSISKQLVELMGGTIQVDSKKSQGSTFEIHLRFKKGSTADLLLPESTEDLNTDILIGTKILLAEDNEMNRLLASTVLGQYGVLVTEAKDGAEAVLAMQQQSFDLILMDLQMPNKDGFEATRQIRNDLASTIPIIALTANAYKEEEVRCLNAGMNDFLSKPFEEEALIQIVARYITPQNKYIGTQQDKVIVAPSEKLYDLQKLRAMTKGDEGFLQKMLQIFVSTMPESMRAMELAFAAQDWTQLAALAHRIKSSLAGMGINSIKDEILLLEANATSDCPKGEISIAFQSVKETVLNVIEQLKDAYKDWF
jgi:PAS domain S-box-containing protein